MLKALERVEQRYPEWVELVRVESVPFHEYVRLMDASDIILDQLYAYTPAMNALQAMSQGLVVVGGAEPEYYELQERELVDAVAVSAQGLRIPLRPIINVEPNEESVYEQLCWLVEHRDEVTRLQKESQAFIRQYHDYIKVARQYLDFWSAH